MLVLWRDLMLHSGPKQMRQTGVCSPSFVLSALSVFYTVDLVVQRRSAWRADWLTLGTDVSKSVFPLILFSSLFPYVSLPWEWTVPFLRVSRRGLVLGYRTPHHTDKVIGSARLPQVSYVDAGGVQTPWPHPLPCLVLIDLTQLYKWYEECSYPWRTPAAIIWWVLSLEDLIQYWKKERKRRVFI